MAQNSLIHSVAWYVPDFFRQFDFVQSLLSIHGLEAKFDESITGKEDIVLLNFNYFPRFEELKSFYLKTQRPTLIIVGTAEQEIEALGFLRPGDDVSRGDIALELIAARLNLILRRTFQQIQVDTIQRIDPLTGLLNRRAFHDELDGILKSFTSSLTKSRAIVFLDIDYFKQINDSFGHDLGDDILREVTQLLLAEAGPDDKLARFGGDEFVLLISRHDAQFILDSVERIRQNLDTHDFKCIPEKNRFHVSASFGVALLDSKSRADESIRQADMAMYEAKKQGRNNVVCFESMQVSEANVDHDINIQHFENLTKVVNERVTSLITLQGRRLMEAARQEANNDALTQLHNRRYFDNRLSREFEVAKKHGRALSIALMDIDKFHDVNINYGWPTGDHVLRIFSKVASENIRLVDWLARYGGEEFCLVMLDTDLDQGVVIADRIRLAVAALDVESLDQRPVKLTISIGLATLSDDIESPVALVQKASKALIVAKNSGRNQVQWQS